MVCSLAHDLTLLYNYDIYLFEKRLTTEFLAALLLSRPLLIHVEVLVGKNVLTCKRIYLMNQFAE